MKGRSTNPMPNSEGALAVLWAAAPAPDSLHQLTEHSPAEAAWTLRAEDQTGVFSRDAQRRLAAHTMLRATQLAAALAVVWFVVVSASPWLVAGALAVLVISGVSENYVRHHGLWVIPLESHAAVIRRRVILGAIAVAYAALAVIAWLKVAPVGSPSVVVPGVLLILILGAIRAARTLARPTDCSDPPDPAVWPPGAEGYAVVAALTKAQSLTPTWHEAVAGQPGYLIAAWVHQLEEDGLLDTERTWNGHIRRVGLTPDGRALADLAREELRRIASPPD